MNPLDTSLYLIFSTFPLELCFVLQTHLQPTALSLGISTQSQTWLVLIDFISSYMDLSHLNESVLIIASSKEVRLPLVSVYQSCKSQHRLIIGNYPFLVPLRSSMIFLNRFITFYIGLLCCLIYVSNDIGHHYQGLRNTGVCI